MAGQVPEQVSEQVSEQAQTTARSSGRASCRPGGAWFPLGRLASTLTPGLSAGSSLSQSTTISTPAELAAGLADCPVPAASLELGLRGNVTESLIVANCHHMPLPPAKLLPCHSASLPHPMDDWPLTEHRRRYHVGIAASLPLHYSNRLHT